MARPKSPPRSLPLIRALSGELFATIGGNSLTGKAIALEYAARIDLEPFQLAGASQRTEIRLFNLALDVRSFRALAGRTYVFPERSLEHVIVDGDARPVGPHAPGSVRLLDQHLPLECRRLELGAFAGAGINASLNVQIDPRSIGVSVSMLNLTTILALGCVRMIGDIAMLNRPDLAQAEVMAAPWLDLCDYVPLFRNGLVDYLPRLTPS